MVDVTGADKMSDTNIASARGPVLSFHIDADTIPIILLPSVRLPYFFPLFLAQRKLVPTIKYNYTHLHVHQDSFSPLFVNGTLTNRWTIGQEKFYTAAHQREPRN